jgi:hypothetical protein
LEVNLAIEIDLKSELQIQMAAGIDSLILLRQTSMKDLQLHQVEQDQHLRERQHLLEKELIRPEKQLQQGKEQLQQEKEPRLSVKQLLPERDQNLVDLDLMIPIQLHQGLNLHRVLLLQGQVTVVTAEDLLQVGQVEGVKIAFSIYLNNL